MVPDTSADSSRPDGAIVTESDSIMSTYNSFDVCRTPAFLHGIAGPCGIFEDDNGVFRGLEGPSIGVDDLYAV